WTRATVAGFLCLSDDGELKPRILFPPNSMHGSTLSKSLTSIVCQQRQAIWVANHNSGERTDSLEHYADALCVPLVHGETILGAIHVYLEHGRFRQSDFDFAISVANITTVALERTRREQSLSAEYQHLAAKLPAQGDIIGQSPPMLELKSRI